MEDLRDLLWKLEEKVVEALIVCAYEPLLLLEI